MKKSLTLLLLIGCCCFAGMGMAQAGDNWNIGQVGVWFGVPPSAYYGDVYGVKIGLPISSGVGRVCGWEASFGASTTQSVNGWQCAFLWTQAKRFLGLQSAIFNYCETRSNGLQFGIVNMTGYNGVQVGIVNWGKNVPLQIGLINIDKGGIQPFMVFLNWDSAYYN